MVFHCIVSRGFAHADRSFLVPARRAESTISLEVDETKEATFEDITDFGKEHGTPHVALC